MKAFFTFTFFILALCLRAVAQTDTTNLPDTVRTETSPDPRIWYNSELPRDLAPYKDSVLLSEDQLPAKIRRTLDDKDELNEWRRGSVYRDNVNGTFKVFIPRGRNIEFFTLSTDGTIVAYRSYIAP
jgi:hypothetical protein